MPNVHLPCWWLFSIRCTIKNIKTKRIPKTIRYIIVGIGYLRGELKQNLDSSVEDVNKAALKALKDLDVFVIEDTLDRHKSIIKGEYADGKKVTIIIEALTERAAKVRIRVGALGDEVKSRTILGAVKDNL